MIDITTSDGPAMLREAMCVNLHYFLRQFRHREIYFYPNPGNAGDSLIACGTYQAFQRAGIAFRILKSSDNITGKIVFLGGGGNFVPLYSEMKNFVMENDLLDRTKQLVILPHTIRGNEDLLSKMDQRVTIFCREVPSYLHVLKNAATRNVYLDHDMAIHVDMDLFSVESEKYTDIPELYRENLIKFNPTVSANNGLCGPQFFMRTDGEARDRPVRKNDIDISNLFQFGTHPENAHKAVGCLFKAISDSGHVTTDRLHVGIACSLLGRDCLLLDNTYGKCVDVYLHTLQKYSNTVKLESELFY